MGKSLIKKVAIGTVIIIIIALVNDYVPLVFVPDKEMISEFQTTIITISTIFAGFSFTTMGMFVGFSTEDLIKKVSNTNIMYKKIERVLTSIVFFLLSCVASLSFIFNMSFLSVNIRDGFHEMAYFLGTGYLIVGIIFFSYAVRELAELLKLIYQYKQKNNVNINQINESLNKAKEKLKDVKYED